MQKDVASLWIGRKLGPIELASIRSFQQQGHIFTLFGYEPVENCPCDVHFRDAREILDIGRIVLHRKTQSPALHSDLFRYAMVAKTDFVWVDLDIVALRPFDFPDDYVLGYEGANSVGSAVLQLPKSSPALSALSGFSPDTRGFPPGLEGYKSFKYRIKNLVAGGLPIERWPWGSIGPQLLTEELRRSGEIKKVRSLAAFYSVPMSEIPSLAVPNGYDVAMAPPEAYAIHLWGSQLTKFVNTNFSGQFHRDSFVSRLLGH